MFCDTTNDILKSWFTIFKHIQFIYIHDERETLEIKVNVEQ
jgi:hypothetical protein